MHWRVRAYRPFLTSSAKDCRTETGRVRRDQSQDLVCASGAANGFAWVIGPNLFPEQYTRTAERDNRPIYPHVGGRNAVSRDHSADQPAAKAQKVGVGSAYPRRL